jgi:cyclopropane-fatty-acyl-phospholipid synthase
MVPDPLVRAGIRRLLDVRRAQIHADDTEAAAARVDSFMEAMRLAPVALVPDKANEQHYEVPAEFFGAVLGPQRKYSSGYWPAGVTSLAAAEEAALADTALHAGLADGQRILELGCGWGSLTLWMAERFTRSRIIAVSNSHSQRAFITAEAARRGFTNIEVITRDINEFTTGARFDRVVSVEMFEHLRNWPEIFRRVASWLEPDGRFFMHVFTHRSTPYAFDVRDATDWMSRHFFSGGMMPSDELPLHFQERLRFVQRWRWDGRHYEKTANAWLARLDAQRDAVLAILGHTYGDAQAAQWLQRWRLFFMACAELFGHRDGQEWWVSHYLMERPAA